MSTKETFIQQWNLVSDEMKTNIDVLSFGKELKVKLGIVNNK